MRVSNVDGNASRIMKSDGEEDEMETDGADAEAERFEKNKSKTAFTARAMECFSVVSELSDRFFRHALRPLPYRNRALRGR